ncbi:MAG: right-handed parallel beta-helix repeat-containing protein [Planctomycetota bacterium]|jgi:hypothetical protein
MDKKLLFVVSLFMTGLCVADVITVDDDGIADFNSIRSAINSANNGDIVIVQPGLYEEDINFLGKNITLTSTNPANQNIVSATMIGCNDGNEATVTFRGTEDVNCTLTGFNINGFVKGFDNAVYPDGENHTHATISHCILQGNEGDSSISTCDGLIANCLIANNLNYSSGMVPVIYSTIEWCHGLIRNCTIVNNYCSNAVEVKEGSSVVIEDCIIYGNQEDRQIFADCPATINILYSDIEGGLDGVWLFGIDCTVNWGPGNIDSDPCFVREGYWDFNEPYTFFEGDYHLQSEAGRWDPNQNQWVIDANTSVCIDAGNPGCPLGSEPIPNGNRINMGAYGGTATASKSPTNWRNIADLTNNWNVNFDDLVIFVQYWLQDDQCLPSDLNRNSMVDFVDFAIFVNEWQ